MDSWNDETRGRPPTHIEDDDDEDEFRILLEDAHNPIHRKEYETFRANIETSRRRLRRLYALIGCVVVLFLVTKVFHGISNENPDFSTADKNLLLSQEEDVLLLPNENVDEEIISGHHNPAGGVASLDEQGAVPLDQGAAADPDDEDGDFGGIISRGSPSSSSSSHSLKDSKKSSKSSSSSSSSSKSKKGAFKSGSKKSPKSWKSKSSSSSSSSSSKSRSKSKKFKSTKSASSSSSSSSRSR